MRQLSATMRRVQPQENQQTRYQIHHGFFPLRSGTDDAVLAGALGRHGLVGAFDGVVPGSLLSNYATPALVMSTFSAPDMKNRV